MLLCIITNLMQEATTLGSMDVVEDQDIASTSNVLDQSKDCHSARASMIQKKAMMMMM